MWYLESDLAAPATTGLTTTISLIGPYNPLFFRENTVIGIGTTAENLEQLKVLNIDPLNQKVRVQRQYNDTTGVAYSSRTVALELPATVNLNVGITTFTSNPPTLQRYFNPSEVVGLGTTAIVGIGTTITYDRFNNIAPPNNLENNNYDAGVGYTSRITPIKTILIPNHSFETGDKLLYSNGGGTSIQVSNGSTFTLSDESIVYAIKESDNLLGISTTKVGLGSTGSFVGLGSTAVQLSFTEIGAGVTHSFKSQTNPLTGNIRIHEATLRTSEPHGLQFADRINISVQPGFTTNIFVQYNDYNRRIVFNRRKFDSVDTTSNTITVSDHNFTKGEKVIFTTGGTAPTGLSDNGMYFVIPIDTNTFKLAITLRNANGPSPIPLRISGSGSGENFVAKVNPEVNGVIGTKVAFALSDTSLSFPASGTNLSAFDLQLFRDHNYKDEFISNGASPAFQVTGVGTVGVTSDAILNVDISEDNPSTLYYNFVPVNVNLSPIEKTEIMVDSEQLRYNRITAQRSSYSAFEYPVGIGSTTFSYLLNSEPEKPSYIKTDGNFSYTTNSSNAKGPIHSIEVVKGGRYKTLPGITSIKTVSGEKAIVRPVGTMGQILDTKLQDVGYDYPSDPTLKVISNVPEVLILEELCSFGEIGVTSGGKNYLVPPNLLVRDGSTNKIIDDVNLSVSLISGSIDSVSILQNTKSLSDTQPTFISINNSNGVGITTIGFNTITKEVSAVFDVGFSTAGSFPFNVGDLVYVENVGIASTGSGYNSADYDYKFFEITSTDPNIGGIGSVTYKLDSTVTYPGLYTTTRSYGRMIPPQDLPIFDATLVTNDFAVGEVVYSGPSATNEGGNIEGTVSTWDRTSKVLKVNAKNEFDKDTIITGRSTLSKAKINQKYDVKSYYNISAAPLVIKGWTKDTGMLNNSTQRLIDSDYYQYFSYSIKSPIAFDTWNEVVSSLNHTSGFKKFGDLIVENIKEGELSPRIAAGSTVDVNIDLTSDVSTYCMSDFDIVTEKTLTISGKTFGNQIIFQNRALTDYEESIGNRVLNIDDFSGEFNSDARPTKFEVIDKFVLSGTRFRRYTLSANDTQFTDQVQTSIIELLIDDRQNGYIQEYGDVDTGLAAYFDFRVKGSEGQLLFYPEKLKVNNYDVHGLAYNVDRGGYVNVGLSSIVGITSIADIVSISDLGTTINSGVATAVNIASFDATAANAAKYLIVSDQDHLHESVNLNILHDSTDVIGVEYGRMNNADLESLAGPGLGTYGATISGGVVYLNFTPTSGATGAAVTFNIAETLFQSGISTLGIGTTQLANGNIVAGFTTIAASGSPGITTVATWGSLEDGAYAIVEVKDVTNDDWQLSEFVISSNANGQVMTEYGVIDTNGSGIGTFEVEYTNDESHLRFVPIPSVITNVRTLYYANKHVGAGTDILPIGNDDILNIEGLYSGTESDIKRAFGLKHGGDQIFTRNIDASDSTIVDLSQDLIIIPNHFFVSGERLSYTPTGTGSTSSIGIGTTTIAGIATDKLPNDLYAIKVDEKSIRLALSADSALESGAGEYLNLTSVGIGTSHVFQAYDQNSKLVVALDNNIQDPVVSTGSTYQLSETTSYGGENIKLSGITSISGADLLKIDDEFMRVKSVGIGSTNSLLVQRGWMGSGFSTHTSGSVITKYNGAYNIVGNTINFFTAPTGPRPAVVADDPDAQDWTGIQTHTTFQGRMFMRSGLVGTSTNTYSTNYIFDSIEDEFNGIGKTFTMKVGGQNVAGFSTDKSLVLLNEMAQGPTQGARINDFNLTENAGITSIIFSGYGASITNDVNSGTVPVGGVIVSVGTTDGFGFQPLVSAGATAIVSGFGTVSSISIGNTGSGYRAGINTLDGTLLEMSYSIGIRTNTDSIVSIGTVLISDGHVTGVVLDAPYSAGTAYTFTDPPIVDIKDPLSYENIPLIYNSDSTGPNIGTNSRANIVVSQETNVVDFELINEGYGYRVGETLTVPLGGVAGIPTSNISSAPVISGGNYAHTFVSATTNGVTANTGSQFTPTNVVYTPSTGNMVLTLGSGHGLTDSNTVSVATSAITLSCTMDGNSSNKGYPRATDPIAGIQTAISAYTSTTITVNVGASPLVRYPVHYATYDGTSGAMSLTIGSHSLTAGTSIRLAPESLVFTCSKDEYKSKHGYPRASDPYYNTAINIDSVGAQTINVNVGVATASEQYTHRFVGAGVSNFTVSLDEVYSDSFSAWHFGALDVLDNLTTEFDGNRQVFILKKDAQPVSIRAAKGSPVDVQQTLLVFVNDILQEPGHGYTFNGGSQITFSETPKIGDTCKILFYKGTEGVDVITRDIVETVKKGDKLTINRNDDQNSSFQQDPRAVAGITTSDTVTTSPYIGSGLSTDTTLARPVTWCRQTQDVVISGKGVGKDRPLYEPQINPTAYIIKSVGIGSTQVYVDDVRPFFDPVREATSTSWQNKVTFISQDAKVGAAATAVVSLAGTITSFVVSDGGVGYTTDPVVTIGNPVGFGTTMRATGDADTGISTTRSGIVTSIKVSSPGSGYTFTSPPNVLIAPPSLITEDDEVQTYNGDAGIIVGFGTTTISSVDRAIFDFHIPYDSNFRSTSYVGTAITMSGISTGDYFVVRNSNVGLATTSVYSRDLDNQIIGVGTEYSDNVYQCQSYTEVTYNVVGVGTTTMKRVYANISGFSTVTFGEPDIYFDSTVYTFDDSGLGSGGSYTGVMTTSNYFGDFSWGRINVIRSETPKSFTFYGSDGIGGISTSALVVRSNPLRHYGYSD